MSNNSKLKKLRLALDKEALKSLELSNKQVDTILNIALGVSGVPKVFGGNS